MGWITKKDLNALENKLDEQTRLLTHMQEQANRLERRLIQLERNVYREVRSGFYNLKFSLEKNGVLSEEKFADQSIYDNMFYETNRYGSLISAVRIFKKLLPVFDASSMVDFGCGTGTWLKAAKGFGISEVLGIDGDYVSRDKLMIAQEEFSPADLERPIVLHRKYDIAISLEVAEHLQESAADILIDSICSSSDIVIFSAAFPGQGGDHHINEQPHEYWQTKFEARGYCYIDIRYLFAGEWEIEEWYRSNIALYVKDFMECSKRLRKICSNYPGSDADMHMIAEESWNKYPFSHLLYDLFSETEKRVQDRDFCFFCLGRVGSKILPYFKGYFKERLKFVSDNDPQKWGKAFSGVPCVEPSRIPLDAFVFIAAGNDDILSDISGQMREAGMDYIPYISSPAGIENEK